MKTGSRSLREEGQGSDRSIIWSACLVGMVVIGGHVFGELREFRDTIFYEDLSTFLRTITHALMPGILARMDSEIMMRIRFSPPGQPPGRVIMVYSEQMPLTYAALSLSLRCDSLSVVEERMALDWMKRR